jgi:hypothetical protein
MGQPKPLGRGLDQLSRAFLTQDAPPAPEEPRPERRSRPEPAADSLLVLPAAAVSRTALTAALPHLLVDIEDGLQVLEESLPCEPCGRIDLLAVDRANRLVIVDLETESGDELLVRGMGHVDWMVGHVPILRRMFRGSTINFSLHPRLVLLAPAFSTRMLCAARQAASPEILWVRYHLAQTAAGPGILLERLPDA